MFCGKETNMALTLLFHVAVGIIVPVIAEIEMEFTKYPESVTAPVGDEVTFECAVRVPGERLTWRWKPDNDNWADWHNINGTSEKENSSSTRLVVQVEVDTVTAFYQCVVWYGAISLVSIPARLAIAKVDLSRNNPERRVITAPVYNTVALHCKEPLSEPAARLNWWKEIKGTKKILDTPNGVLVIKNATIEDSGTYGCTATNDISERSVDLPERTYLKIQHEGHGGIRFLETDDFVGTIDKDGVLTVPVMPDGALRLWCGLVGTPPPRVTWSMGTDINLPEQSQYLLVQPFTAEHEGIYSCSSNGIRRSWKAIALQPPHWEGSVGSVNVIEGSEAKIVCGTPHGHPAPKVHWVFNAKLVKSGKGIKATDSELLIERVEKRHAGIVQCFACNSLGCAYDAALLVVVPMQISQDQDYSAETPKTQHIHSQPPKRHNKKNPRKNKAVLIPPSRPNVTRLSDESVMVSWSHDNHGLPIQFYKVQYRDVTSPNTQWQTENYDIPAHIHSFEIDGLVPDKYYKFRIAAVYSNQDNKSGRSSSKFFLQKGGFQSPRAPVLDKATALSPHSVQINWTWTSDGGVEAEGFYVYYRAVSSAGAYEKVTAGGRARGLALPHLAPDTAYEVKIQAYTAQAPSDFSAILIAKTQRALNTAVTSTEASAKEERGSSPTLVTAGGVAGAALLLVLIVTLLLCRRAKRPTSGKEKGSPEGGANGYLPAKVPITITANPMHGEGGDGGVEMSFLHNNNCGNATSSDDNLPARKNRQYV